MLPTAVATVAGRRPRREHRPIHLRRWLAGAVASRAARIPTRSRAGAEARFRAARAGKGAARCGLRAEALPAGPRPVPTRWRSSSRRGTESPPVRTIRSQIAAGRGRTGATREPLPPRLRCVPTHLRSSPRLRTEFRRRRTVRGETAPGRRRTGATLACELSQAVHTGFARRV